MRKTLAEVLNGYLAIRRWSFEKLAEEARLPRNTVYRWTKDEVKRVRHWQDVAKAARALGLNRTQVNALLGTSGHPSIDVLLERSGEEEDRRLLSNWVLMTPNNLPAQLTSFFGREDELDRLSELLSSVRLVTVTGAGGSGKTRLALEAADAVLDEFERVALVDLAPVHDPALVIPTIAQALGLTESFDDPPLLTLKGFLRHKSLFLVLDNFEQVVEAAPQLTDLLEAACSVKALVTSRTRLGVRGERELALTPLALPDADSSFEELKLNPSVALFTDRACAVDPSFMLNASSASIVAEMCIRLDGLPLAIELAAARTRHVSLSSLLERFPTRLELASRGPRDVPDRQRALRATIEWSYDLLDRGVQPLFNCLGVFEGGFTEAAAGSVFAALGRSELAVSDDLETLAEQNLVKRVWGATGDSRFELLETIREYALERLQERGEAETARWAATQHYLDLAERADLEGPAQADWLRILTTEHDNFRAALSWCSERGQIQTGLRLCVALMPMWQLRDHQVEARTWLDGFMAADGEVTPNLTAKGLLWRGLLLLRATGDDSTSSRHFEEALVLFRYAGDLNGVSEALQAQGDVSRNQRRWERASQHYHESLKVAEQTGNAYLVAHGWMGLALCAQEEGRAEPAQHYWEQMLVWAKKAGNDATLALASNSLGEMARSRGDWEEADRCYQRTLTLARELGNDFRIALALHNLGYVALYREDHEAADRLFTDALSLYKGRQYRKGVAECLAGLGRVEASKGDPERAARLCGATEAILKSLGTRLDSLDRADYERTLGLLTSRLGENLETTLGEGRGMSMETAVQYALTHHFTEGQC